jgi:DNA-directed RNA polymerase subunit RPC12/RpoP
MSDSGTWELKCSQCGHVFVLELLASDSIVEASRSSQCPNCLHAPVLAPLENKEAFHRIVGFHVKQPLAPNGRQR